MNALTRRSFVLVVGLLCSVAASSVAHAAAAKSAKPAPPATFERTKSRIDALLTLRLKPTSLPDNLPNPFELNEAVPKPATSEQEHKPLPETLPPETDSEMLVYYGAMLKISGTVRLNDRTHLIINQSAYKEGDIFTLKTKDTTAKLRIVGIAPGELTLGLNEAVQVIKFKK